MTTVDKDKVILSIVAAIISAAAWSLILAGSFVPRWARPLNVSRVDANVTYSLWGREDCYGIICTTRFRTEFSETKTWYWEDGQRKEHISYKEEKVPIVECHEANYCNITWFHDSDVSTDDIPSLLLVARAFILPSLVCGLLTVLLYILKVVMLVLRPLWRRIYVKAAYLTFSAISGVAAGIAVIIFISMLEKDQYEVLWAPALPGSGGLLLLLIAVGGYLSWRNKSSMDDWDDRSEWSDRTSNLYEFHSTGNKADKHHTELKDKVHRKGYLRSVSSHSNKSDIFI